MVSVARHSYAAGGLPALISGLIIFSALLATVRSFAHSLGESPDEESWGIALAHSCHAGGATLLKSLPVMGLSTIVLYFVTH